MELQQNPGPMRTRILKLCNSFYDECVKLKATMEREKWLFRRKKVLIAKV